MAKLYRFLRFQERQTQEKAPIGPSSELTHADRPYELTLLVSTVLVQLKMCRKWLEIELYCQTKLRSLLSIEWCLFNLP